MINSKTIDESITRIDWIDNARAISCILVILTHILGPWVYQLNQLSLYNRFFIIIFFTISKLCTPTFLMISGSLLVPKNYKDLTPHKRRIKRILSSFMLWSIIYIIFYTLLNISRGYEYTFHSYLIFIKDSFLFGAAYHLWFMYLIIGIYFLMPILSNLFQKISKLHLIIFYIIWGISLILNLFFEQNKFEEIISSTIGYLGYLMIGFVITKYKLNVKIRARYSFIIFVLGVILTFIVAYYQFNQSKTVTVNTFHRLNINIAFVAIGFFLMSKSLRYKFEIFTNISKYSLGIYYVHLFIIMFLNQLWNISNSSFILFKLIIFALITLIMCFVIIKYMENILGRFKIFKSLIIT